MQEVQSDIRSSPSLHVSSQKILSVFSDSVKMTCLKVYTEIVWVNFLLVHIDQTEILIYIKLALINFFQKLLV